MSRHRMHGLVAMGAMILLALTTSPSSAQAATLRVRQISAGYNFTCAVTGDNAAWCWGANMDNGVGDLTAKDQYRPVRVHKRSGGLLGSVRSISAGERGACAITLDAELWCWGMGNSFPQPSQRGAYHVEGIDHVTQVSATDSVCARTQAGAAWCWGTNWSGEVGIGNLGAVGSPTVIIPSGVLSVQTGAGHTCALKIDNSVWCWGTNEFGELGDGTKTQRLAPVRVKGIAGGYLTGTTQIGDPNGTHQCALLNGGQAVCWGLDGVGQLGDGQVNARRPRPVHVRLNRANLDHIKAISTGNGHTCALRQNGTVLCWGWGQSGQLGNGAVPLAQRTPVKVVQGHGSLHGIASISAGAVHTCAVTKGGVAWCWGSNYNGGLGYGKHTTMSRVPVKVTFPG
jgi:alpha-tubulin suppressor-like RCC1 family protein